MSFFEWKERMGIGDSALDRDHQTLMQYVNEMHEAALSGRGKEAVGPILDKLATYTREHFAREEEFLKAHRYADFQQHKRQHDDCLKAVADFQARYATGSIALAIDVAHFMRHWLQSHTLKSDKRAADAIAASRHSSSAPGSAA